MVKKIHSVVLFDQGPWLKSFMEFNIKQRREAVSIEYNSHVAIIKLSMNAVIGKTMENVQTHLNIELFTSSKITKKSIAKPNFKGSKRFYGDLLAVELTRPNVELTKPIQVGFSILDLSKRHIYDGYYNTWLHHFPKS